MASLRDIRQPGRRDVFFIDPKLIKIEKGFNPRQYDLFENREHLNELKRSIVEVGVLVPLMVRWDGEQAILIDGECRLRSCLELIKEGVEIKSVPVLQETTNDEGQRLLLAISANKGKPLSLLEAGGAYKRLVAYGWSVSDIGAKTGMSVRHIRDAIGLHESPVEVKEMVSKGEVTPSLAKQVVRQKGDKAAAALKEKVSQAKAAGKKGPAKRQKAEGKAQVKVITDWFAQRDVADELCDRLIEDGGFQDTNYYRLAKKWNKLRGR